MCNLLCSMAFPLLFWSTGMVIALEFHSILVILSLIALILILELGKDCYTYNLKSEFSIVVSLLRSLKRILVESMGFLGYSIAELMSCCWCIGFLFHIVTAYEFIGRCYQIFEDLFIELHSMIAVCLFCCRTILDLGDKHSEFQVAICFAGHWCYFAFWR